MPSVIKLICHADGQHSPYDGQYLQSFDFEAHGGQGEAAYTPNLALALKFQEHEAAFAFWKTQSKVRPIRPDGKPNRPLTAATVEIVRLSEEGKPGYSTPVGASQQGNVRFVCPHCAFGTWSPNALLTHVAEKHQ